MSKILFLFLILKTIEKVLESYLHFINKKYYSDPQRQKEACATLGLDDEKFKKTYNYTVAKYNFSTLTGWVSLVLSLAFVFFGGFGYVENLAISLSQSGSESTLTGLYFFLIIGALLFVFDLPFDFYSTFKVEGKFGFNRQTVSSFFLDKLKGLVVSLILFSVFLYGVLTFMSLGGSYWWLWVWGFISCFSLFTSWIYPTLLAPIFNKFKPLDEGELKDNIFELSEKIGFKTSGISIMDASTRSTHSNAYFTGMFGAKKIVLFDTLVKSLTPNEIVGVLAHELGHFKLNHVRWGIARSIIMTGLMFYLLSLCLSFEDFYLAFHLTGVSNYGALLVFSMWFGLLNFILIPLGSWLSRKNEFEADAFAVKNISDKNILASALVKLSDSNHSMPITHPLFSSFYYSHPPILERIKFIKKQK
tara:strand:- start:2056 stop:3309 length:1254 start_codon:yes stop_codon:yes gene_type:complete